MTGKQQSRVIAPPFPLLLMLFTAPALLFLISLIVSRSSTAEELQRRQRHLFDISVPDTARINPQGEEYVCTVQRLNLTTEKAIYLEEFVYSFANHGSAHHFLLYGCKSVGRYALENQYWPCNARGKGNLCLERKHIPLGISQQNSRRDPKFDEPARFPDNVAYGIGPLFEINYLMLEVHFMAERKADQVHINVTGLADEISDTPFVDQGGHYNSGLVAHGSTKRPKYLAGMMVMAGVGFNIPPGQKNFSVNINCQPDLSLPIFPYAYWVHTHELGKVVSGYKVNKTNGKFTEFARWIHHRPQPVILDLELSKSVLAIHPGDYVASKCTYDSTNAKTDVHWGPHHKFDEMCNLFLFYFTLSTNPKDLSIPCVNEKSNEISKRFPADASTLPQQVDNSSILLKNQQNIPDNPICILYRHYRIKNCPFIQ